MHNLFWVVEVSHSHFVNNIFSYFNLLNLLIVLNFDFCRDYEWCDQEGEEEGRMEGKKCIIINI